MARTAEEIWYDYKDTSSFKRRIIELAEAEGLEAGDITTVQATWAEYPVDIELHYNEDSLDVLARPKFMGETLDVKPIVIKPEEIKVTPPRHPKI